MKLKGKKKLQRRLRKAFIEATEYQNIPKMYADTDFAFYPEENCITFGLAVSETSDRYWKEFLRNEYEFQLGNIFVMSVLHEIGHFVRYDYLEEEDYEKISEQKEEIEYRLSKLRIHSKKYRETYKEYFGLRDERLATEWAIEWIRENPKQAKQLCDTCNELIANFYIRNGVCDE